MEIIHLKYRFAILAANQYEGQVGVNDILFSSDFIDDIIDKVKELNYDFYQVLDFDKRTCFEFKNVREFEYLIKNIDNDLTCK